MGDPSPDNNYKSGMIPSFAVSSLVKDGLATRDEEYYSLTKKERFVVLDKNNDRIQPSLNMSNVDSKIRKAKEKQEQEMLKK